jgi:GNAT superfamily N-acetyltransferase
VPSIDQILYYLSRILARLTGNSIRLIRYYFVAQPVPEAPSATAARASKFSIRLAGQVDAVIGSAPRPRTVLERRFRDGATCIVAECDGQLAGFIWLMEREYMEDEVRCLYRLDSRAKAAWDFDVYVVPAYRATRLFTRLWDSANEWLRSRGYRWSVSRISAFNEASLAAHRRFGTLKLGTGTFVTVGPVQASVFSNKPYLHLALTRGSFPVVTLPANTEALSA